MPPSYPAAPLPAAQAQQAAAFLQNAQLGGVDLSVLQNISPEQLAVISQLIQAGVFPLPQSQNPVHAPVQVPAPVEQNGAAKSQNNVDMDLDKEEGEVEDGEVAPQAEPDFLRPPPTGPRKRSGSMHRNGNDKRPRRQPSPPRQPKGYDRRRPERRPSNQISSPPQSPIRQRRAKHDAAKAFVLATYRAGFSFDDLAREIGDAKMLRVLFKELDLNVPSAEVAQTQQQPHAFSPAQSAQNAAATPVSAPVIDATAKPAAKRAPAPKVSASAPVDRSEYLAKLQAAKNKKNEASLSTPAQPPAAQSPTPAAASLPKKVMIQTDLVRKKLEALKAERALKTEQARKDEADRLSNITAIAERPASNSLPQSQPKLDSLPDDPVDNHLQRQQPVPASESSPPISAPQPTIASTQATGFTSQFPGLPGLFMNGAAPAAPAQVLPVAPVATQPPVDASSSSHVTSARSSPHLPASEPKPVPSALQSGRTTPRHPFNQSRYDSNDDSVIIHVSDEEESELDDDMDESEDISLAPAANPPTPATKPGPLRNFPVQGTSAAASPLATPGATTPGGTAYQRKLQEIEEMNRRIAEMQKQAKKPKATTKLPFSPADTAPAPSADAILAAAALPGLTGNTVDAPVANGATTQPAGPESTESSQQMEVKLAQLKEEAEMISEKRTTDPSTTSQSIPSPQPANLNVNNDAASPAPSDEDDDDDDAMDLSSGEDSDSESESEVDDHTDTTHEQTTHDVQNEVHDQTNVAQGESMSQQDSDSSDDSDDSSTDSEEESDEDYEPAPAASDLGFPLDNAAEPTHSAQPTSLPEAEPPIVPPTDIAHPSIDPQDADLAPEIQPLVRGEENATPEVRQFDLALLHD